MIKLDRPPTAGDPPALVCALTRPSAPALNTLANVTSMVKNHAIEPGRRCGMERITITIDEDLLDVVDQLMQQRGYTSRSEAVRDMIRDAAARVKVSQNNNPCIAVLDYVYDHDTRGLGQRLAEGFHARHDLTRASMQVHLDHESCLAVSVLQGTAAAIHDFSNAIITQRGVRHSNLHVVPAEVSNIRHDHGSGPMTHPHVHV
jgi:CopG family nickel-responsive transcriptional regulator